MAYRHEDEKKTHWGQSSTHVHVLKFLKIHKLSQFDNNMYISWHIGS